MDFMSAHISVEGLTKTHFKGMSPNTMLRWRHRFLSAFVSNGQVAMTGVVQADEKFFRQSFKGDAKAVTHLGYINLLKSWRPNNNVWRNFTGLRWSRRLRP